MKLKIDDFIFEVKDELSCYDEIGAEKAEKWAESFKKWAVDESIKKKSIKKIKDTFYYFIDDESEIFDIADEYLDALENNKEKEYWKNLK